MKACGALLFLDKPVDGYVNEEFRRAYLINWKLSLTIAIMTSVSLLIAVMV